MDNKRPAGMRRRLQKRKERWREGESWLNRKPEQTFSGSIIDIKGEDNKIDVHPQNYPFCSFFVVETSEYLT